MKSLNKTLYLIKEKNFQGAVNAVFKKGVKYAEQVGDHSKSAISIMFCGSASGVLLPPYVVYKAGLGTFYRYCTGSKIIEKYLNM